jgi:hypothetical protein
MAKVWQLMVRVLHMISSFLPMSASQELQGVAIGVRQTIIDFETYQTSGCRQNDTLCGR